MISQPGGVCVQQQLTSDPHQSLNHQIQEPQKPHPINRQQSATDFMVKKTIVLEIVIKLFKTLVQIFSVPTKPYF